MQQRVNHGGRVKVQSLTDQSTLLGLCVSLGMGLLVGAERERRKDTGSARRAAGIRTFVVCALLGSVSVILGGGLVLAVTVLMVGAGVLVAYQRTENQGPGMTTEFALLLTCLLGALAMRESMLAAGVGAVLALLLSARESLHHFVRRVITAQELKDIILFSAMALIVLPLAPDRFMGPFDAINPHAVARLIVVVMALSAMGYVAMRSLGPRYGLPLAGFAAGFVSSAATVYAMGERVSRQPALMGGAVAGAALSSIATIIQMTVVIGLIQTSLLTELAWPLLLGGLAASLYGLVFFWRRAPASPAEDTVGDAGRAFSLKTAVVFAAMVCLILLVSAGLNNWFGTNAMLLGSALSGLADAHATAASAASLMAAGKISSAQAVTPILMGLTTNTLMKAVLAFKSGGSRYAWRIVPGLALMIAAVWLGAWMG